jgi:LuxR family maltose regulon positive regulatory protein
LTALQLIRGDKTSAEKWLSTNALPHELHLYKIYQHFATAKAMMVKSKLSAADKLLEKMAVFSQEYNRNADYIEALTLRTICLWRLNRTADAIKTFTATICRAAELQLVMPIIRYGGDILPMLQKMLNRLKYGYDNDLLDKAFVNLLFLQARSIAKHAPGMFQHSEAKPVKLSPRQAEVVDYLLQNLSYKEIGEKMGITTSTADYHIHILHEKFGVSNTRDLLQKAQELGFVNID